MTTCEDRADTRSPASTKPVNTMLYLRLLLVALLTGCASSRPADLVLFGGRITTLEPELGEVSALAARDGRIVAVGADEDVLRLAGDGTRRIDLAGRRAVPGFIEGHAHFLGLGQSMQILDLRELRTWDDAIAMVASAVAEAEPGEWILGRGWHQEKWDSAPAEAVEGFPSHAALSAVSPDNPVCLRHASGHACFFNAAAMELAGVDASTEDPPGGEILRHPDGSPSGVFREKAAALVESAHAEALAGRTPAERREAVRRAAELAARECLSKGVTSFQDAGTDLESLALLREVAEDGDLGLRLWVMIRDDNEELAGALAEVRTEGDHFTVRALKRSLDGALGSRGAWLLEPYSDSASSTGLNTATLESVAETARLALEHDYQLCVHAIGDRANREVLDLYESTLGEAGLLGSDHRWRIEHAQHLHPDDIPRFASLGIVASMQGVHCTSDAVFVEDRLGERRAREGAYVWRTLAESGALVTNGTDAPVEDVDPLPSYRATVTRELADGTRFYPDQRLGRLEALETYTVNAARSAFEEDVKGTLAPGKFADVVVLDEDLLEVADEHLDDVRVLMTIVGGEVLYEAGTP